MLYSHSPPSDKKNPTPKTKPLLSCKLSPGFFFCPKYHSCLRILGNLSLKYILLLKFVSVPFFFSFPCFPNQLFLLFTHGSLYLLQSCSPLPPAVFLSVQFLGFLSITAHILSFQLSKTDCKVNKLFNWVNPATFMLFFPFFPLPFTTSINMYLLFDTTWYSLVMVEIPVTSRFLIKSDFYFGGILIFWLFSKPFRKLYVQQREI